MKTAVKQIIDFVSSDDYNKLWPNLKNEWFNVFLDKEKEEIMNRQNIIVFIQGDRIETYGNLKKCCELEGLKYWTLSRLKFPIRLGDVVIHKTLFK